MNRNLVQQGAMFLGNFSTLLYPRDKKNHQLESITTQTKEVLMVFPDEVPSIWTVVFKNSEQLEASLSPTMISESW